MRPNTSRTQAMPKPPTVRGRCLAAGHWAEVMGFRDRLPGRCWEGGAAGRGGLGKTAAPLIMQVRAVMESRPPGALASQPPASSQPQAVRAAGPPCQWPPPLAPSQSRAGAVALHSALRSGGTPPSHRTLPKQGLSSSSYSQD